MAVIFSTTLNRSDEIGHPGLVLGPDLRGKPFSLSSLKIMLAVGFS